MIDPDDYPLSYFGVIFAGKFGTSGEPIGWKIENILHEAMPRILLSQPVLFLENDEGYSVYVRGLYSWNLSKQRQDAVKYD